MKKEEKQILDDIGTEFGILFNVVDNPSMA